MQAYSLPVVQSSADQNAFNTMLQNGFKLPWPASGLLAQNQFNITKMLKKLKSSANEAQKAQNQAIETPGMFLLFGSDKDGVLGPDGGVLGNAEDTTVVESAGKLDLSALMYPISSVGVFSGKIPVPVKAISKPVETVNNSKSIQKLQIDKAFKLPTRQSTTNSQLTEQSGSPKPDETHKKLLSIFHNNRHHASQAMVNKAHMLHSAFSPKLLLSPNTQALHKKLPHVNFIAASKKMKTPVLLPKGIKLNSYPGNKNELMLRAIILLKQMQKNAAEK